MSFDVTAEFFGNFSYFSVWDLLGGETKEVRRVAITLVQSRVAVSEPTAQMSGKSRDFDIEGADVREQRNRSQCRQFLFWMSEINIRACPELLLHIVDYAAHGAPEFAGNIGANDIVQYTVERLVERFLRERCAEDSTLSRTDMIHCSQPRLQLLQRGRLSRDGPESIPVHLVGLPL